MEQLEDMVELQNPDTYKFYNETIRTMKSHCIHYLHTLDTGRYDDDGGTTKLDRHRVNLCRKEIENILKRIKINGELPSNHYTRIAMAHAYQYLAKVKKLREDVSYVSCFSVTHLFLEQLANRIAIFTSLTTAYVLMEISSNCYQFYILVLSNYLK